MSDKERMTDNEIIKALECCSANYIACKECPFNSKSFCERYVIENAFDFVKRQQTEIERLESLVKTQDIEIDELNKFANERLDKFTERYDRNLKAEAIKEFADRFDDVLAGMRDEYAHNGRPEYGLVCEVVHHKLLKTVREMTGVEND